MTTNTIGRVLCKIAAAYFAVQAAQGISYVVPIAYSDTGGYTGFLVSLLVAVGAPLLIGFLLWKYADRIAGSGDAPSEQRVSTDLTKDDLLEAGLVLIGVGAILFGISRALPVEFSDLWYRLSQDDESQFLDQILIRNWGVRLGYLLQIAMGFALIYGRQSIIDYIHRARRIGSGGS